MLRIDAADVEHAACKDEYPEVPLTISLLCRDTGKIEMLSIDDLALGDRSTICLQAAILRMRANREEREGDGEHCSSDTVEHIKVTPGVFNEQVRTEDELTDEVEDCTAKTGHCIGDTKHETELSLEPAVQKTCDHEPQKRDLANTHEETGNIPLPELGVERHAEDAARSEDCSDGADDACVVLLEQRTDDGRENNFSEIDDRHVEGHI